MSNVTSFGYVDTPVSGVTAATIAVPTLNYSANFALKSNLAGEAVLTNTSMPFDQTEKIRFGYSEVADVYKGSDLSPDQYATSRSGVNLLAQVTENVKVTDSVTGATLCYLPLSAHVVLKLPKSAYLTEAVITQLVNRTVAALYQDGTTRYAGLFKGSLVPKGL